MKKDKKLKAEAPGNVYSASCPSRLALDMIGNKWSLLIIPLLATRTFRNNELMREVEGISQKMLTQTLRELERSGLVERIDFRTVPPHVEYSLSPLGRSLSQLLVVVDRWVESHLPDMRGAQENFDLRQPAEPRRLP
jgi:DNA-binding HxlR family transcriptional regulator